MSAFIIVSMKYDQYGPPPKKKKIEKTVMGVSPMQNAEILTVICGKLELQKEQVERVEKT